MELAAHNWMRIESIETTLARLARLGYSSLEISGEPDRWDVADVRSRLDHYGLSCWGAVTLMMDGLNLQSASEEVREASIAYAKRCVDLVDGLDGKILSLVPGTVGKITPDADPETEWGWVVEGVRDIAEYAAARGIRTGIEPLNRFEAYLINRCDQALELADAAGVEGVGVVLDIFHMHMEESDPLEAIRQAGDRIVDFHVADNNRMPAGLGSIDWPSVVDTLREVGYDGALSAEFAPTMGRTPRGLAAGVEDANGSEDASGAQLKFLTDHGSATFSEAYYTWMTEQNAKTLSPLIRAAR